MTPDERLEAAAERWAMTVDEAIQTRVKLSLALERDRLDGELAEIREQIAWLGRRTANLAAMLPTDDTRHSVRAE